MVSSTTITDGADDARRKPGWDGGATATGVVGLDHDGHLDAPAARPGRRAPHGLAAQDARHGRAGRPGAGHRERTGRTGRGLLAGINPLAGLYAYLFGMVGATFHEQHLHGGAGDRGDGAHRRGLRPRSRADPDRALYTLAIMTGHRDDRGRGGAAAAGAVRPHGRDDRIHHRRRREHHPRAAVQFHRLRLAGREPAPRSSTCCSHPAGRPRFGHGRTAGHGRARSCSCCHAAGVARVWWWPSCSDPGLAVLLGVSVDAGAAAERHRRRAAGAAAARAPEHR